MSARWTKSGWESLLVIADNAVAFTGHPESGLKIIAETERIWNLIQPTNALWKPINNIFEQERFWHTFSDGKIIYWKKDQNGPIFVGVSYSLQDPLFF